MASCATTSAHSGIVSTTTPLDRSESRGQPRRQLFFSRLLSGVIVKFHFKAAGVRKGKRMKPPEQPDSIQLLQIVSRIAR